GCRCRRWTSARASAPWPTSRSPTCASSRDWGPTRPPTSGSCQRSSRPAKPPPRALCPPSVRRSVRAGRLPRTPRGEALARLPGKEQILLVALREAVRMALCQRLAQPGQELRVLRARESADPLHGRDVPVELVGAEREAGLQHGRWHRFELRAG